MAKHARKTKLHVSYPDAQRVRTRLLQADAPTLSERERDTVLQILRDVYPIRQRSAARRRPQSHQRRPAYRRPVNNKR